MYNVKLSPIILEYFKNPSCLINKYYSICLVIKYVYRMDSRRQFNKRESSIAVDIILRNTYNLYNIKLMCLISSSYTFGTSFITNGRLFVPNKIFIRLVSVLIFTFITASNRNYIIFMNLKLIDYQVSENNRRLTMEVSI